jgi:diguanylate cyclase (GGDEF)-like protein
MSHAELLAKVPLFSHLAPEHLTRIAESTREEEYSEGDEIVSLGEAGHTMYVLLEGRVEVLYPGRSQNLTFARLDAGDFFGEMALLNEEPRSASVRAMTPVRVLAIEKDDFRSLVQESTQAAFALLEALSYRVRSVGLQAGDLHERSLRDPLTGLLNRRAFQERIHEEVGRAQRYGEKFSLLILDVDQFKLLNDTFGHDAGDEVLKWIGRILMEHTRAADAPFRIGGEEFAIMAPSAPPEIAAQIGERLRATFARSHPPLPRDTTVTISVGYATCPDHARRSESLFQMADQAVLQAKARGRNRVEGPDGVADTNMPDPKGLRRQTDDA